MKEDTKIVASLSILTGQLAFLVTAENLTSENSLTLLHMGGGGGGGRTDSTRLQIVFFITSVRDAAEPRNLVTFPKI